MFKKILIIFLTLAALASVALNVFSKKAPEFLRQAIERSLDKPVKIGEIQYQFPLVFKLKNFEINENTDSRFAGEKLFYVQELSLELAIESLSRESLIVDEVNFENAEVIFRKFKGKISHPFEGLLVTPAKAGLENEVSAGKNYLKPLPLDIGIIRFKNSHVRFQDYDASDEGFVLDFQNLEATVKYVSFPAPKNKPVLYEAKAKLAQGKQERSAVLLSSGWFYPASGDTDLSLSLMNGYLPYYKPYYSQVTPVNIQEGFLNSKVQAHVINNDLTATVDFEILNLLFETPEGDDSLFGLNSSELLSFLKDRSGKLRFRVPLRWNTESTSLDRRKMIRAGIERALKMTILGHVGDILHRTIAEVSSEGGIENKKENLEAKLKKVKDWFKY